MSEMIRTGPELERLRETYGEQWRIWRSRLGTYWMATRRIHDNTAPTLMEDSAADLEAKLQNPGTWGDRAYGQGVKESGG
ncbi:hypothetical protein [Nocardiopsis sp. NPDC055824]